MTPNKICLIFDFLKFSTLDKKCQLKIIVCDGCQVPAPKGRRYQIFLCLNVRIISLGIRFASWLQYLCYVHLLKSIIFNF